MKYPVAYDADSKTLVIGPAGADADSDKVVSHIVFGEIGEVPDGSSHPEPAQHLRNIALQQGIDDYSLVSVENESGNERLDRFAQQADEDKSARMEQREDMLVLDNRPYAHVQNAGPDQTSVDLSTGEKLKDGEGDDSNDTGSTEKQGGADGQATEQKPETAAQKRAREKAEADKTK